MAAFRSASFCLICFLICSSEAQKRITADLGQDVILQCEIPNNNNITVVEWIRPDQDPEYVLFYRDGHFDPDNQHPSYQNRVDLQDKEMKDGKVSLILKNVTMEDTGIYECRAFQIGSNRNKRSNLKTDPISIINLEVYPSGDKDEIVRTGGDKTGIIVGPVVGVILLAVLGFVGFLIYRQLRRHHQHRSVLPNEAAAEQMLWKTSSEPSPACVSLMEAASEPRGSRCGPTMWSLL